MKEYRPSTLSSLPLFATPRVPNSALAASDPPRETRAQATRWNTQDAAYIALPLGASRPIMEHLRVGAATCDECEVALGISHQTCSAAINKLMRLGFIVATGSRKTRSGRVARVWTVR